MKKSMWVNVSILIKSYFVSNFIVLKKSMKEGGSVLIVRYFKTKYKLIMPQKSALFLLLTVKYHFF